MSKVETLLNDTTTLDDDDRTLLRAGLEARDASSGTFIVGHRQLARIMAEELGEEAPSETAIRRWRKGRYLNQ